MVIISHNLKKLAHLLRFAAKLVKENVFGFLDGLQRIMKEDENFVKDAREPLTLSMIGFNRVNALSRAMPLDKTQHNTVPKILSFFLEALALAGKENRDMLALHNYLKEKWGNLRSVKDQKDVLSMLKHALTGMSALVKSES